MTAEDMVRRWTIGRVLKVVAMSIGLFVVTLVALFIAFFWWISSGVFSTSRFDASLWFAQQTRETDITCYRGGMVNDIKDRLLRPKISVTEVEQLLGQPDMKFSGEYRYVLGMCSGLGWDYDDLHIYFDSQGKMTRAAIIQH